MASSSMQVLILSLRFLNALLVTKVAAGTSAVMRTAAVSEAAYATMVLDGWRASGSGSASTQTVDAGSSTYHPTPTGHQVQFSSSVILFDVGDISSTVRQNGRAANWCALIANNIKQFKSDRINFVLTQYWMPVSTSQHFDIKHFCYRATGGGPCKRFTQDVINRFEQHMSDCFAVAISQGFKTIMVTAHIDNALDGYQWRNYVELNPEQQYDGYSFNDIQLKPLSKAINKNLGQGAQFLFNLGGELGTSYFGWPGRWLKLMDESRQLALSNGKDKHSNELQIGIKINFERVAGYASQLPGGVKQDLAKRLFDACNYIAISAYAPMPVKPEAYRFADSAAIADAELRQHGITLQGKELWYGEFGIGGGSSQYCDKLANTPLEAGATPQYGTCWQYNNDMNPWKNKAVRQYMQDYYTAALKWLQAGASSSSWNIKGVFAWNLVSWDVQGVHPLSYAGDGASFKDARVSQMITEHNKAIMS